MESLDNKGQGEAAVSEQSEMQQGSRIVLAGGRPKKIRRWAAGIVGGVVIAGGLTFGGFKYVEEHTYPYYTVYSGDTVIGTIADKKQLDELIAKKKREFAKKYPGADMKLYTANIRAEEAEGYKAVPDTEATLSKLDGSIKAYATGVELVVGGKVVGIVKDEATAKKLVRKAEKSYIQKGTQTAGRATKKLASTGSAASKDGSTAKLDSIKINEKIAYNETKTSPTRILTEEEAYKLLTVGEEDPVTYTVAEGDTVSSIAAKFGITQDELYANNTDIEEFTLQIGQVLRITLPDPAMTVTTVESVSELIPTAPEMVIRRNPDLAAGKRIVASPGKSGSKRVDYRLTKENGEIVREEWIGQEVVRRSAPIIIVKGTKVIVEEKPVAEEKVEADPAQKGEERSSGSSSESESQSSESSSSPSKSGDDNQEEVTSSGSGFSWPVSGASISSTFGTRWGKLHAGVDLTGPSTIMASAPGTVTYAGQMNGYGNIVIISHGDGFETRYGHLSSIGVSVGQSVSRGQSIGVMGNTGHSTGTHLHFEIRQGGTPQNPLSYLP
ncbi:M23 family metallopeptidase [Saccharibacillus alkalitolerans]|uniref:Peptidoglycan DD-metalloendopeptidase family protein n=1 Tax=Saccharibacillus alkalitolerans TaxID=2705290 RepID=A0ABX0F6K1_9BACL|nr:M23 family metallopeptidase [Saccharibacillus alkalitolerans]NGZ76583.1 peptidoglycan DD-metalloendopeptidase family protein [Saccharibacillus alkalitolerans]